MEEQKMENDFKVIIRNRPLKKLEFCEQSNLKSEQILFSDQINKTVTYKKGGEEDQSFCFDTIIDPEEDYRSVYSQVIQPLVISALSGYHATIMAYGQTGSGKTYNIRGFIMRTSYQIFEFIEQHLEIQFVIKVSIFELFNDKIIDLLDFKNQNFYIKENEGTGANIEGLTEFIVTNQQQMMRVIYKGQENKNCLRTHLSVNCTKDHTFVHVKIQTLQSKNSVLIGKTSLIQFVDLAGSESHPKRQQEKEIFHFVQTINKLSQKNEDNTDYGISKLTRLLQNSLGGNCKTALLATVWIQSFYGTDILNTLQFANQAQKVKNQASVNQILNQIGLDSLIQNIQCLYRDRSIEFKTALQTQNSKVENNQLEQSDFDDNDDKDEEGEKEEYVLENKEE